VRILIGVATYSIDDLLLLDRIVRRLRMSHPTESIQVFDVTATEHGGTISDFMPQLTAATQTPFVGVWRDGQPAEGAAGRKAKDLIAEILGL
jgi:hypothetical protein